MTRKEFMRELDRRIIDLDYEEKMNVFKFFEEYFDDLGTNLDDEIPENMNLEKIVEDILKEENKGKYNFYTDSEYFSKNKIKEIKYDTLDEIIIQDTLSELVIRKGYENKILTTDRNLKNIEYSNGTLEIQDVVSKKIEIHYNQNDVDFDISDFVGNIKLEIPEKTTIELKDIVGEIQFIGQNKINELDIDDIMGKVNSSEITFDEDSEVYIYIDDVIGNIKFEN